MTPPPPPPPPHPSPAGPADLLPDRLRAALAIRDPKAVEHVGDTLVVRVDFIDRRYRDAIKAGADPVEPPRDEVGLGAWRRVARLTHPDAALPLTLWSDR